MLEKYIGKMCIVRGKNSGVFYGEIERVTEKMVFFKTARKIWSWSGACAVEQIAEHGVDVTSKLTIKVEGTAINDWCQILICTEKSIKSLNEVREWIK